MMTTTKLTYFDFNGGRGEDCRLALHAAGVPFVDDRIKGRDWPQHKGNAPWGALPVFERDGKKLGQSNAILTLIGRETGMHPSDPWQAAQHEAIMNACEELRNRTDKVMMVKEEPARQEAREKFADNGLQAMGGYFESCFGDGPFLGADKLTVADLKLFVVQKWFRSGGVDHVRADALDGFAKLTAQYNAVLAHDAVKSWYANH